MVGYMNAEALARTIETGEAHYLSRSRQALWHKGATSGLVQKLRELLVDDDQDCIWLRVTSPAAPAAMWATAAAFTGAFRRSAKARDDGRALPLEFTMTEKVFDPELVYPGPAQPDQALSPRWRQCQRAAGSSSPRRRA